MGQRQQNRLVFVQQGDAGLAVKVGPATPLRQRVLVQGAEILVLVHHFQKQQQHQLGDVIAVVDAVVAQYIAEVPEFLNNIVMGHGCPDSGGGEVSVLLGEQANQRHVDVVVAAANLFFNQKARFDKLFEVFGGGYA
jgi:hypothetical protein